MAALPHTSEPSALRDLDPVLRLHEALAQQPLCSSELHAQRSALADPSDDLDLRMALLGPKNELQHNVAYTCENWTIETHLETRKLGHRNTSCRKSSEVLLLSKRVPERTRFAKKL